ncbi:MAG: hypothetical protein WC822_07410 [Candidatus Paceibacterota bacterium]|jgi:hypothetical protein
MSKARFTSNRSAFLRKNSQFVDMVGAHMAQDIEIALKTGGLTPVKTGDLKGEMRHEKIKRGHYRVESPKEYSAVQEQGQRKGARAFTKYTTSGTGKGFFKKAVNSIVRNANSYVDEVARSVRL